MQTETLQITLPVELAKMIRERVRTGGFASESDVIIDRFEVDDLWLVSSEQAAEDQLWIAAELPKIVAELESGQMKTYTADEVREHLKARHLGDTATS